MPRPTRSFLRRRPRPGARLAVALAVAALGACQPAATGTPACPQGAAAELPGVDVSDLTTRERCEWSQLVSELLAPCPAEAVSLAECVTTNRACAACRPATVWLARQVRSGKPKGDVVELFDARFDPRRVKTIVVGDSPAEGPLGAPVTIVEWADFECPSCGAVAPLVRKLVGLHAKDVRFVFKHYPISFHANALMAAHAAVAAQRQGKFWPMHERMFAQRERLTQGDLEKLAGELGLDVERFRADLESDVTAAQVERDKAQGESLGVHSTPTLFINGREVSMRAFSEPERDLDEWISLEIELASKAAPATAPAAAAPTPAAGTGSTPATTTPAASATAPAAPETPP